MSHRIFKRVAFVSFIALAALVLTMAQGTSAADFPKMTIKLGHVANPDFNYHKGTVKFAELINERTGGAVTARCFPTVNWATKTT